MGPRRTGRAFSIALVGASLAVPATAVAQSSSEGEGAFAVLFALGVTALASAITCLAYVAVLVVGVGSLVLWILALVDLAQRRDAEFPGALEGQANANEKIVWLLIVLLAGILGALVYYMIVMKKYPRARADGAEDSVPPSAAGEDPSGGSESSDLASG